MKERKASTKEGEMMETTRRKRMIKKYYCIIEEKIKTRSRSNDDEVVECFKVKQIKVKS